MEFDCEAGGNGIQNEALFSFFPPVLSSLPRPPRPSHFSWGDGGAAALSSEDQKRRRWKVNGSGGERGRSERQ